MAISFTSTSLTPGARQNADLTNELEKLKLQQAIAAAQKGQSATTGESPAQLQAARLAAALQQQQQASVVNRDLQTQRLQVGSQDLSAKLLAQANMQNAQQAGNRAIQGDRIQSTEKINTQNLAAQLQRQGIDIQGKKDLTTLGTDEELRKRKNAATNALALFNASPGKSLNKLNPQAAAAQLA